jgi:hypothetical protein
MKQVAIQSILPGDLGGGHARTKRGFNYLPLEGNTIAPAYRLASTRLGWG